MGFLIPPYPHPHNPLLIARSYLTISPLLFAVYPPYQKNIFMEIGG